MRKPPHSASHSFRSLLFLRRCSGPVARMLCTATFSNCPRRASVVWSGASRLARITVRIARTKPSVWRRGKRNTTRSVKAVSIASPKTVAGRPSDQTAELARRPGVWREPQRHIASTDQGRGRRPANSPPDRASCTWDARATSSHDHAARAVDTTVARKRPGHSAAVHQRPDPKPRRTGSAPASITAR